LLFLKAEGGIFVQQEGGKNKRKKKTNWGKVHLLPQAGRSRLEHGKKQVTAGNSYARTLSRRKKGQFFWGFVIMSANLMSKRDIGDREPRGKGVGGGVPSLLVVQKLLGLNAVHLKHGMIRPLHEEREGREEKVVPFDHQRGTSSA